MLYLLPAVVLYNISTIHKILLDNSGCDVVGAHLISPIEYTVIYLIVGKCVFAI